MLEQVISNKAGWTRVAFGDVARNINDYFDRDGDEATRYIAGEHVDEANLKVRRWGMTNDGFFPPTFKRKFQAGDVLFHSRNIKKLAIPDFDGVTGEKLFVLRSKDESLLSQEFLGYMLSGESFYDYAEEHWSGSVNKFLNWKPLSEYEFLLPPIQEQARLVEMFAAQRAAYESLQELEDRILNVQAAFIQDFLAKEFKHSKVLKVKDLLTEGPRNGKSPTAAEGQGGFKSVSISSISNGHFTPEGSIKFVDLEQTEAKPFLVRAGDAFAVRGNGNRNLMGKVGLSAQSFNDLIYPDLLIRLRFDETIILKEFAVAQWNHPTVHIRLAARAKSSNGIWKVNGQDIRAHTLTVPPLDQQRKIVAALRQYRSKIASVEERRLQLRDLLKKLHEKAFSVTVTS